MLRTMICGLGLAWATTATATAQTPVSVHPTTLPGTVVPVRAGQPPAPMPAPAAKSPADMSRPLNEILQTPLPTSPTVPAPAIASAPVPQPAAGCATCATAANAGCQPAGCGRNLLGRLKEWFCYSPRGRVLPVFTPTPHTAPLSAYYTCHPGAMACAPGQPVRAAVKAEPAACRTGRTGQCGTPRVGGRLFDRCDPCRPTLLDRLLGMFGSEKCGHPVNCLSGTCGAGGVAITTAASGPLNCSVGCPPATVGVCGQRPYTYRFANPLCPPVAPGYGPAGQNPPPAPAATLPTAPAPAAMPAPTMPPSANTPTPAVTKPFTNP